MSRLPITFAALVAVPAAVPAQDGAPFTYDAFEVAVPHVDLEGCPEALAGEGVFCRATLNLEEIHVFAFSEEGDSPFLGMESYPADGIIDAAE